jgi:hypothetical protein
MLLFTVTNWRLEPTPELLQIAAFRAILDADRTRDKRDAVADLLYIYGMEQNPGPFSDFAAVAREKQVRRSVYGDQDAGPSETNFPVRWNRILTGVLAYRSHNDNAEQRLMNELDYSLDMVTDFIRTSRLNGISDAKQMGAIIKSIGDVKNLLTNKQQAEKLLVEGLEKSKARGKGNVEASPLERGLLAGVLQIGQRKGTGQ